MFMFSSLQLVEDVSQLRASPIAQNARAFESELIRTVKELQNSLLRVGK